MNFFRKLNRKQKRKFDKIELEEKKQIVSHEINQKIKERLNREVSIAFADGFLFANKMLYDKYYEKWNSAKYNEKHKIAKSMIEEIVSNAIRYDNRHNIKENKKETIESEVTE